MGAARESLGDFSCRIARHRRVRRHGYGQAGRLLRYVEGGEDCRGRRRIDERGRYEGPRRHDRDDIGGQGGRGGDSRATRLAPEWWIPPWSWARPGTCRRSISACRRRSPGHRMPAVLQGGEPAHLRRPRRLLRGRAVHAAVGARAAGRSYVTAGWVELRADSLFRGPKQRPQKRPKYWYGDRNGKCSIYAACGWRKSKVPTKVPTGAASCAAVAPSFAAIHV